MEHEWKYKEEYPAWSGASDLEYVICEHCKETQTRKKESKELVNPWNIFPCEGSVEARLVAEAKDHAHLPRNKSVPSIFVLREGFFVFDLSDIASIYYENDNYQIGLKSGGTAKVRYQGGANDPVFRLSRTWVAFRTEQDYLQEKEEGK